jgi:hypothetical protein
MTKLRPFTFNPINETTRKSRSIKGGMLRQPQHPWDNQRQRPSKQEEHIRDTKVQITSKNIRRSSMKKCDKRMKLLSSSQ